MTKTRREEGRGGEGVLGEDTISVFVCLSSNQLAVRWPERTEGVSSGE